MKDFNYPITFRAKVIVRGTADREPNMRHICERLNNIEIKDMEVIQDWLSNDNEPVIIFTLI